MSLPFKLYRVLIASPRDASRERTIVRQEIARWNSMHAEEMQMVLLPVGWETDATPDLQERGQAIINRQLVDNCDLLIGIFRTRLGTPTPEADSGTVEEIERAEHQGKRCIVYFSDQTSQSIQIDQVQYDRLQNYRQELNTKGLTDNYTTFNEFREKISRHLMKAIRDIAKEDQERRAIKQEAKTTERVIGLPIQLVSPLPYAPLSFDTFANAQVSIKQLLESRFGLEDMEDIKEQEIAKIQEVLASPDFAMLVSQGATTETISAIVAILETACTPAMYALAAIGRYSNENADEWLNFAGEWVERLLIREQESGFAWASHIKRYPGLLLLYALGISSLRAAKGNFLRDVLERFVYFRDYDCEIRLSTAVHPTHIFHGQVRQLIEPGFERRFTPVNDHLCGVIHGILYPHEEESRYISSFDLFEFLLSLKVIQVGEDHIYPGSFNWRSESSRVIIRAIQDAALNQGKAGKAILNLFGGEEALTETAAKYDEIAKHSQQDFFRVGPPTYLSQLIRQAKSGKRIRNYRTVLHELAQL